VNKIASSDRFTVIAIAIIVYAGANITHEIIGHCGTMLVLSGKCSFISTTDIRLVPEFPELAMWKFRIVAFPLAAKWALFVAAGGTWGLTFWLLLLPLGIPGANIAMGHPFVVRRSFGWVVAGALSALAFIGVL
jgi:hypothetical protein